MWESVGLPVDFCGISCENPCAFLWDFLWVSVRILTEILWEWELKFHSHGNPAIYTKIINTPLYF